MKLLNKYWHFLILGLMALTPVIWFLGKDPSALINGLDTNFPLNPVVWLVRRFYVWNGVVNAGVDFSSSTSGLFFHLVQTVPYILGFTLRNVEVISLVFWFSSIVFASYCLAKIVIPENKLAQIIVVAIYSYNIYLFNTWENVKVSNLSLVASLPLFVAVTYAWVNKKIKTHRAILYLSFTSILASGSGINPAYFSVIFIALTTEIIILVLSHLQLDFIKRIILVFISTVLIIMLINSFWILPLANFLISNKTGGLSDLGLTNWLSSLSVNTSILNILRLQGAWDWYILDNFGMPQYLPYTLNYLYSLPFIIFSFALSVLSLISLLIPNAKNRFWYAYFGVLTVLSIFLGVGSHSPTGNIFMFIYNHVPLLSFFRSPWYIFTPLLTISYAVLVGLLFVRIRGLATQKLQIILAYTGAILFLLCYGFYNYPLILGKIYRPDKAKGFLVKFPDYVWDSVKWLSKNEDGQRIITYPDDDLESFDWGYQGTESILSLFSKREVITPSFNIASPAFSSLLKDFYFHIKRGEYKSALSVLNFFGVNEIFLKNDVSTLSPQITDSINDLVTTTSFDNWKFLRVNSHTSSKFYLAETTYNNYSFPDTSVFQASLFDNNFTIVNGTKDSQVLKLPNVDNFLILLRAENYGPQKDEVNNIQKYRFSLSRSGVFNAEIERFYLRKTDLKITIDSNTLEPSKLSEGESFIKVGPLSLGRGVHTLEVMYPITENLADVKDFSSFSEDAGLRKEELPSDTKNVLSAVNLSGYDQRITIPVKSFNPFLRYAIGFDYKYFYGSVPIVDAVQSISTAPVKTLPIYPGLSQDWETKYSIFRPVETESKLGLYLRLPPNKQGDRSKSFFTNIFIKRLYDNKVFIVEKKTTNLGVQTSDITFVKKSPVEYQIDLGPNIKDTGKIVVFSENYSSGWKARPEGGASTVVPIHFTANGYANGWYMPVGSPSKFNIYYEPQNLFISGMAASLITLFAAIMFNFVDKPGNKNEKIN
ncbi:DUF3367 domain-containing protein [Candidatus Woesebacteria bacterium]|nr:DUF3367 domain-containing protein [Candidatus Woesebacteria bacterium]